MWKWHKAASSMELIQVLGTQTHRYRIYKDTKLTFEFIQILKPFKNKTIVVMKAKYIPYYRKLTLKKIYALGNSRQGN